MNCKNCRYWTGQQSMRGECRRYPPQVVAIVSKDEFEEGIYTKIEYMHPERHETDWCGEHKPTDK